MAQCMEQLKALVNSGDISPNTTVGELLNMGAERPPALPTDAGPAPAIGVPGGLGQVPQG